MLNNQRVYGIMEQPQYVRIFTTQPVQWDRIDPWNGGLTKKTGDFSI